MLESLGGLNSLYVNVLSLLGKLRTDGKMTDITRRMVVDTLLTLRHVSHKAGFLYTLNTTEQILGRYDPKMPVGGPQDYEKFKLTPDQTISRLEQINENFRKDAQERMVY